MEDEAWLFVVLGAFIVGAWIYELISKRNRK